MILLNGISYIAPKQLLYSNDDVTTVCGEIYGTWESGKVYFMTCDCEVPENKTLIIEPGVTVIA